MPSAYAHYRFGAMLLQRLPEARREALLRHRPLFDIGLHGPDILFYYHPLWKNPTRAVGRDMHRRSGRVFFQRSAAWVRGLDGEARRRAEAYMLGFVGHFALDRACHPYVERRVAQTGVTHTEIEVEFDRRLLALDGCPERCPVAHISAAPECAEVIAPFFPGVRRKQIALALRSMRRYGRLLDARRPWLRNLIRRVCALIDPRGELPGWMATGKNPACDETCRGLLERFDAGLDQALALFGEFDASLAGAMPLNAAYDVTFGGAREGEKG